MDDITRLFQEHKAQRTKKRQEQKVALFAYLAEKRPEIQLIKVPYNGSGDEGWVDDVELLDADDQPMELEDTELGDMLDELWWLVTPEGFENNDGGQGTITVYPATQRIVVEHGQNYLATVHEEYEVKDGEPLPSRFE